MSNFQVAEVINYCCLNLISFSIFQKFVQIDEKQGKPHKSLTFTKLKDRGQYKLQLFK